MNVTRVCLELLKHQPYDSVRLGSSVWSSVVYPVNLKLVSHLRRQGICSLLVVD